MNPARPWFFLSPSGGGGGDVTGPASSTDNAIVRFNGTGGKTLQNSGVTIDDSNTLTVPNDIVFTEAADHTSTPAAGSGYLWVRNDAPSSLIFTDDAGTDVDLTNIGGDTKSTYFFSAIELEVDNANVSRGVSHSGIGPTVSFADGVTGISSLWAQVPEGYSSVSAIRVFYEDASASALVVRAHFFTAHWDTDAAGNADTLDTTDAEASYTTGGTANTMGIITVPAGAYDGLTLDAGDLFGFQIRRIGGSASDTYGAAWEVLGVEIVWA